MAAIAAESEVSKALLHYHFVDRAQLLAEWPRRLDAVWLPRERGALERGTAGNAIDSLRHWLHAALERGELRALLELRTIRDGERLRKQPAHAILPPWQR